MLLGRHSLFLFKLSLCQIHGYDLNFHRVSDLWACDLEEGVRRKQNKTKDYDPNSRFSAKCQISSNLIQPMYDEWA